jgi:hypothetical protein
VDPKIGRSPFRRAALGGVCGLLLATLPAAQIASAQEPDQPPAAPDQAPVAATPPPADTGAAAAPPPAAPVAVAPPPAAPDDESDTPEAPGHKPAPPKPAEQALNPPEPPKAVRSPVAILQTLDKVTAETLRFAAPIGRRVRYKTLVFTVRACETSGVDDPQPRAAAYVLVESEPRGLPGRPRPPAKQVFKGWMFASAPGLHPLEHPVYDAWLIACSAAAPPV